jgi:hypothetical protein
VDLTAANRQLLRGTGLRDEHVTICATTTSDPGLFSDRTARPCGRFALLARLTGDRSAAEGRPAP